MVVLICSRVLTAHCDLCYQYSKKCCERMPERERGGKHLARQLAQEERAGSEVWSDMGPPFCPSAVSKATSAEVNINWCPQLFAAPVCSLWLV